MRNTLITAILLLSCPITIIAQNVGIGTTTPEATAQLDISSTSKGILIPRMSLSQRTAITSPATGLLIYQSDPSDSSFYWYDGNAWIKLQSSKSGWSLSGNSATNPATQFMGTTDDKPLLFRANNIRAGTIDAANKNVLFGTRAGLNLAASARENTVFGDSALGAATISPIGMVAIGYNAQSLTTTNVNYATVMGWNAGKTNRGSWSTIIGASAGMTNHANGNTMIGSSAGMKNITGFQNTFVGDNAGRENQTGIDNAFFGSYSGPINTGSYNAFFGALTGANNVSGSFNSFFGEQTGYSSSSGSHNSFFGPRAGRSTSTGNYNVFLGSLAGYGNSVGSGSVAIGYSALYSLNGGNNIWCVAIGDSAGYLNNAVENIFVGAAAGKNNTAGYKNTFIGTRAGYTNAGGWSNTALGNAALYNNGSAAFNTAVGDSALYANTSGNFNTAVGSGALQTTSVQAGNVAMGFRALQNSTGGYNTAVGSRALFSNTGQSDNTAIGNNADVANGGIYNAAVIGSNAIVGASNTMSFGGPNTQFWAFARPTVTAGAALQVGQPGFSNGNGAYLSTGGTWFNASDENLKSNITAINGQDILNKIVQLNITQWDYTSTTSKETHIGPMAQQFKQLFGLGIANNDKSVSTIDPAGIALAGIQELKKENEALKKMVLALIEQVKAIQK
ncbi:MAG: tail fiber domain-containing protein [Bacteroidota bacterium]